MAGAGLFAEPDLILFHERLRHAVSPWVVIELGGHRTPGTQPGAALGNGDFLGIHIHLASVGLF